MDDKNMIHTFLHCLKCADEKPTGESLQSYSRYDVGATPIGIQIWCRRHDEEVAHIDRELLEKLAEKPRCDCPFCMTLGKQKRR